MQKLSDIFLYIDAYLSGAQWFVFLLLGTGLFFTIYLKFPQIRYLGHAIKVLTGRFDKDHHIGDTSHFQSLTAALSGTIGTGNIAGVALAIHLGGPSALFWMMVTAFFGMTTKLVEVTLSHKYREVTDDGSIAGGPMYYMKNRLHMRWLSVIFAVATIICAFGTGSMPQINSIAGAMYSAFDIEHWITGAVLALLMGFIIIGGIKRIVKVTEKIVPIMAIFYLLGAAAVLITNYENIIPSVVSIFSNVFSGTAATGGFLGAGFAWAFNRGVNRGLFSNEAGQGSAPIAHAAARASEPVSEGLVSVLEPFVDTIIICSLTGIVLLSSGVWKEKIDNTFQYSDMVVLAEKYEEAVEEDRAKVANFVAGAEMLPLYNGALNVENGVITQAPTIIHSRSFAEDINISSGGKPYTGEVKVHNGRATLTTPNGATITFKGKSLMHSAPLSTAAFKRSFLGDIGQYIIPLSLLLFAFSTAVAWSYYGDRAVTFLWGTKYVMLFRLIYVVMFFVASFVDTSIIWAFTGISIAMMTIPNLVGILLLHKEVKSTIKQYWIDFAAEFPNEKIPK